MNKFSLIVATLNRTQELNDLLVSLVNQTYKEFEVIIVDQNSDDRLKNIIDSYLNDLDIKHMKCQSKGASHARNQGINIAKGDILTFPDDDCEYPEDLLIRVDKELENSSVSGISVSSHDKNGDDRIARFSKKTKTITKKNLFKTCIEFGVFIRKNCLNNIKFDENLGVGSPTMLWSDEGPDLLLQLINKGHTFCFVSDLYIYHPDPVKAYDEKSIIRSYRYGCGRGAYLRKHTYPVWFVIHVWLLYVAGIIIALLQLKPNKIKYYYRGLIGRITGYFFRQRFLKNAGKSIFP